MADEQFHYIHNLLRCAQIPNADDIYTILFYKHMWNASVWERAALAKAFPTLFLHYTNYSIQVKAKESEIVMQSATIFSQSSTLRRRCCSNIQGG